MLRNLAVDDDSMLLATHKILFKDISCVEESELCVHEV